MTVGKASAQAGHAYTNSLLTAIEQSPQTANQYEEVGRIGTKICLKAKTLSQLEMTYAKAKMLGLPCSLITDSGHVMPPHFDGNPIVTALGVGPINQQEAKLLSKFRLVE